jgi:hypothetical protein
MFVHITLIMYGFYLRAVYMWYHVVQVHIDRVRVCLLTAAPKRYMSMERHGRIILTGENRRTWEKNLSRCHFVHHESYMDLPGHPR